MGKSERIDIKCAGCGATLQSEDQKAPGYVPKTALTDDAKIICQRCFRMKNYNEASSITVDENAFVQILNHVGTTNSLVVHIVDIFDFEGSLITGLARFVGNNPIIIAVNKIDLLPAKTNPNKVMNWVRRQLKLLDIKVVDVVPISAKHNVGFDKLAESMEKARRGRDIYVVGATNVGKSSMINNLIRQFSDLDTELTTSRFPGTTLDVVEIPIDDGNFIIDTPGIVYTNRLTEKVNVHDLKALMPDKPMKPRIYQLNPEQTLFFGGFARFDFVQGERQSFTCYISNELNIHRTKLENADRIFEEHKGVMLSPPNAEGIEALGPWQRHSFTIGAGEEKDISISGLGWVRVHGTTGAKVEVYVARGVKVAVREALI